MREDFFKHITILDHERQLEGHTINDFKSCSTFNFFFKDKGKIYLLYRSGMSDDLVFRGLQISRQFYWQGKKKGQLKRAYIYWNEDWNKNGEKPEKIEEWKQYGFITQEFMDFVGKTLKENYLKSLKESIAHNKELIAKQEEDLKKYESNS